MGGICPQARVVASLARDGPGGVPHGGGGRGRRPEPVGEVGVTCVYELVLRGALSDWTMAPIFITPPPRANGTPNTYTRMRRLPCRLPARGPHVLIAGMHHSFKAYAISPNDIFAMSDDGPRRGDCICGHPPLNYGRLLVNILMAHDPTHPPQSGFLALLGPGVVGGVGYSVGCGHWPISLP